MPVHLLLFISVIRFIFIWFCSVLFSLVFEYSIIQCRFLFWYRNCISGISIRSKTTIRQVNKHYTPDFAIFCLGIGSESLLPSKTLVRYLETISPIGLAEGKRGIKICINTYSIGPVGQRFASHLGGQQFTSRGYTHS